MKHRDTEARRKTGERTEKDRKKRVGERKSRGELREGESIKEGVKKGITKWDKVGHGD